MSDGDLRFPDEYFPDWERLANADSEEVFAETAFELLREAALLASTVSSVAPVEGHTRDSAIPCALLLKAAKQVRSLLYICQELEGERQLALNRELLETVAVLRYLLDEASGDDRFDRYVQNSLVAEREFLRNVDTNVKARGGEPLPIEIRIRDSIATAAKAGGFPELDDLPARGSIGFPNAETLIAALGPNAYSTYRMGSVVLHSQWSNLWLNHLRQDPDGTFTVIEEQGGRRPQPLTMACRLLSNITRVYLRSAFPAASGDLVRVFDPQLESLEARIDQVRESHEQYLGREGA